MRKGKLKTRIAILLVCFTALALVANIAWSTTTLTGRSKSEMLEKARIIAAQMESSWDFVSLNQERIDTDSDGSYHFKGIYCAIAGKSISKLFAQKTDYIIRHVSETPRNPTAIADDFEQQAFTAFGDGSSEYYMITTYDNREVFRYVVPLVVEEGCVSCHGSPQGEIDITGYPKEGFAVGDVAGAMDIIMPIGLNLENVRSTISQQVLFTFVITAGLMVLIYMSLSSMVTKPLSGLSGVARRVGEGDFDCEIPHAGSSRELIDLASNLKLMARQLKSTYVNLEDQVHNRTIELQEANEILERQRIELEQANSRLQEESEYKTELLAIMSHELRTPLTSILAFAEVLLENTSPDNVREITALYEIRDNGQILLQMINNTLETARIEAGKLELCKEPVDVVDLIGVVEAALEPLAKKKGLHLETFVDRRTPIINADGEMIRRIIENLTSNAIKYTEAGGTVRISAKASEKRGFAEIAVADNGSGIHEDRIPHIFEKFVQVDEVPKRRCNGSGLGLAVVRELVAAHEGEIEVQSAVGEGSTFTVLLPIGKIELGEDDDDESDAG